MLEGEIKNRLKMRIIKPSRSRYNMGAKEKREA
jgi:hypothetical protein